MQDIALLRALLPGSALRVYEETISTNSDARAWLKAGAAHGSLVVAARQSGGRGRMGHSFASAEGGLYMSLILQSNQPAGAVTTLCAVAVRRAVSALCGVSLDIKWVNDLLYRDRKVCGILCEGVFEGERLLGIVAGVGLNVCQREFPPALREIAASLYPDGQPPAPLEAFAARIAREILAMLPASPAHMAEYRAACVTLGRAVRWQRADGWREGVARDVDDTGALLIDTPGGPAVLNAGEVSVRRADD